MSAGTITLTNGSAIVGGSGTSFATELAAGDFIVSTVGGVPYTLPVKTVDSNTQVTLVSNFTGPTQSGAAWSAVPRVALNMVTAALVAQSAEALRGLNYDKQNWQQIFSGSGDITVKLPGGSSWNGPSWNSLTTSVLMKKDNLSGIADQDKARKNIGIATRTGITDIIKVGDTVYQSWMVIGTAIGDYNPQKIGDTTYYTHYFHFTLPLSLNFGIGSAVATLVGSNFGQQTSEIPAFVRVRRDDDSGSSISKTTLTVSVTTPVTGWVPYIHIMLTGA